MRTQFKAICTHLCFIQRPTTPVSTYPMRCLGWFYTMWPFRKWFCLGASLIWLVGNSVGNLYNVWLTEESRGEFLLFLFFNLFPHCLIVFFLLSLILPVVIQSVFLSQKRWVCPGWVDPFMLLKSHRFFFDTYMTTRSFSFLLCLCLPMCIFCDPIHNWSWGHSLCTKPHFVRSISQMCESKDLIAAKMCWHFTLINVLNHFWFLSFFTFY